MDVETSLPHWSMDDLLFDWFGFDQTSKADANST